MIEAGVMWCYDNHNNLQIFSGDDELRMGEGCTNEPKKNESVKEAKDEMTMNTILKKNESKMKDKICDIK